MLLSFTQCIEYATTNHDDINSLSSPQNTIVICPPTSAIYPLINMFESKNIAIGAQNCSAYNRGSYTGQTAAQSLQEIGCSYSIIGHAERRKYNHETDDDIAQKCLHLLDHGIIPIVCIGEDATIYESGKTLEHLDKQLSNILSLTSTLPIATQKTFCIAYEPIWSIGTGIIPNPDHLETVFSWIHKKTIDADSDRDWKLLYGGSVSSDNIASLKKISFIDGFLIGSASTNFQEFKKIVHSVEG